MSIADYVHELPLIDHHAHFLIRGDVPNRAERLLRVSSEADSQYPIQDTANRLAWAAFQAEAGRLDSQTGAAFAAGQTPEKALKPMDAATYARYNQQAFARDNFQAMFIDTGFVPDDAILDLDETATITGLTIRPIFRIETQAEHWLREVGQDGFTPWLAALTQEVAEARAHGFVGFKSIAAYRFGLKLMPVTQADALAAFTNWQAHYAATGEYRLTNATLISYILWQLAPILIDTQMPLQFHVGYGDADTDLYAGNPLLLRTFLQAFTAKGLKVVLLHCYPYQREAGYLASVFANVYFDISLADTLAPSSMPRIFEEALELAPHSRFLFASDASTYVEMYTVASRLFKNALIQHLDALTDVPNVQKEAWARMLCYENAEKVYGVKVNQSGAKRV